MTKKELIRLLKQDYGEDVDWIGVLNLLQRHYFHIDEEEAIYLKLERERNS
jgi:hypothetical protein